MKINNQLPFELTNAQKRVLKEIRKDVGSGAQMNRLLQGDVGSGKTIVALLSMLLAIDNGYQATIMAPTEILANQHYVAVSELLKGMNISVDILTGSVKTKKRREIHTNLEDGSLNILVGTHALLEDKVQFKNLGIAIIDEQHRFGVKQRAKLWSKNTLPPHILVMTATPIPRTLAMSVYGDLDISVIDELPPGRKEVKTVRKCHNISDTILCEICNNPKRDASLVCVVEDIRDVMAIENTSQFRGLYHVLGGKISPIEGIGPQNLEIDSLIEKVKNNEIKELIFALSSTMEGDTTNFYIFKQIEKFGVATSTIARGISVGDELEYADEVTLGRSIVNRIPFEQRMKL